MSRNVADLIQPRRPLRMSAEYGRMQKLTIRTPTLPSSETWLSLVPSTAPTLTLVSLPTPSTLPSLSGPRFTSRRVSLTPRSGCPHSKLGLGADDRLFGVTTLDVVRSSRFLGEIKNKDPKDIEVTVVGGHSGVTIVPLLSQTSIGKDVKGEEYKALVKRIQFGGDEVVQAKAGTGSATLSMGFG